MDAAAVALGGTGIDPISLFLKATLILTGAWVLAVAARRSSAAVRHGIWAAALLGVIALPLWAAWLPPLPIEMPGALVTPSPPPPTALAAAGTGAGAAGVPSISNGAGAVAEGGSLAAQPTAHAGVSGASIDWRLILVAVWLGGVAARAAWLAVQLARVRRLTHGAQPIHRDYRAHAAAEVARLLRVRRPVLLLESARVATPVTCGLRRPIILLPRESKEWPEERLRVVLLHEIAHIHRWDYFVCLVAEAACALYWPIPQVWVARHALHAEQEQASDDLVLAAGTAAVDYADHLLAIARALRGESGTFSATIGMAREIGLKRRIRTILDGRTRRVPLRSWHGAATLIALFGFALPVAALRPAGSAATEARGAVPEPIPGSPSSGAPDPVAAAPVELANVYLWLEAEHGLLREGLELREELDASAGHYVFAPEDSRAGQTLLSLHLPRGGEYLVWARIGRGEEEESSFSVAVDDGVGVPLSVPADGDRNGDWTWARVNEDGGRRLRLGAGVHTLRITDAGGEARLDRLLVTTDSDYHPSGRGATPDGFDPAYTWIDVDAAVATGPAEYTFDVHAAGSYVLWGRVLGRNGEANSLFLSVDGGEELIWDAPRRDLGRLEGRWTWDPASARDLGGRNVDPLILDLAPGRHTIKVRPREEGTGLGGLLVTNDLAYRPRGTPPGSPPVRVWLEPEKAAPVEALRLRTGRGATGEGYLEATDRGDDRRRPDDDGAAQLRFDLPLPGVYTLWARTIAPSGNEDSFWIRVNDGSWVRWNGIPRSRDWRWSTVHDGDGDVDAVQFALPAGSNRIEIARREGGARIDRLLVTNDDSFEPRPSPAE